MTRRSLAFPVAAVMASLLLPVATFLVTTLLLGWRLEAVESGSMAPLFPVGSLVVVRPVDPSQVGVGTALVFVPDDGRPLVTHRVVQVLRPDAGGVSFRTKGDANATIDPNPVPDRAVRGRAAWAVPQLGRVVRWLAWPRAFVLFVVLPAIALAVTELAELGARARRSRSPASRLSPTA